MVEGVVGFVTGENTGTPMGRWYYDGTPPTEEWPEWVDAYEIGSEVMVATVDGRGWKRPMQRSLLGTRYKRSET